MINDDAEIQAINNLQMMRLGHGHTKEKRKCNNK
jgi:hypothetical protein